ncbi:c-type cytochrome [Phormidesmis sp. 146-35]
MKSRSRILSGFLFLLVLVGAVLLGVTGAYSSEDFSHNLGNPRLIQRGRYLVVAAGNCAGCHSRNRSPDDPTWLAGYLPGTPGLPFQVGQFQIYPSNITPDDETGIGSWTPQQVFNSLSHGKDNEGNTICPPMPWVYFRNQRDRDNWAIVAYLKNGIKPVKNQVPANTAPDGTRPDCSPLFQEAQSLPAYPGTNEIKVRSDRR